MEYQGFGEEYNVENRKRVGNYAGKRGWEEYKVTGNLIDPWNNGLYLCECVLVLVREEVVGGVGFQGGHPAQQGHLQSHQLYMTVCFWCLVNRDMSSTC